MIAIIDYAAGNILVCKEMLPKRFLRSNFHNAKITHFLIPRLDRNR